MNSLLEFFELYGASTVYYIPANELVEVEDVVRDGYLIYVGNPDDDYDDYAYTYKLTDTGKAILNTLPSGDPETDT